VSTRNPKDVAAPLAGHPAVFATLTAPSFGPVHTRHVNPKTGKVAPCRMRRTITRCPHGKLLVCTARHTENHLSLGRPLRLDCYDHAHHVVWNAWAGELWRRTTIRLTRSLRPLAKAHGVKLRISYGKVAEYQRRGVVHFHALIRLDQVLPDDPDAISPHQRKSPPPISPSSSPAPSPTPGSTPPATSTPATPGPSTGDRNSTSARSGTSAPDRSPPKRSPPIWRSTPPRPPKRQGSRRPGG